MTALYLVNKSRTRFRSLSARLVTTSITCNDSVATSPQQQQLIALHYMYEYISTIYGPYKQCYAYTLVLTSTAMYISN